MSDSTNPIMSRVERDRQRLAELEAQERHMLAVVGAIIRKYGEDNGQGRKVVRISDEDLANARESELSRWDDMDTGAIVYGVQP